MYTLNHSRLTSNLFSEPFKQKMEGPELNTNYKRYRNPYLETSSVPGMGKEVFKCRPLAS